MIDHVPGDARSNRERMEAGEPYFADAELDELSAQAARLADLYRRQTLDGDPCAQDTLADLIGGLGEEVAVRPPLSVDYGTYISIGARTFINSNLTALDVRRIAIGEDCQIGPNVQLLTPTHPLDPAERRTGVESAEPITIGDNVWLGGGVIVCPGVTIGDDSVIGAGSVVTTDVPAGVIAVGNPARVIRNVGGTSGEAAAARV